ncbi:MAG: LPS export ABC transporter periplasmic protein LptC [Bacteroidetes bacterium]|nr:LPS export ABC transporter periplasmic protein LptC [Bacteroidota bacterium]
MNSPLFFRIFYSLIPAAIFILVSCSKAPLENDTLLVQENDPVMSAHNIDVLFSDSGKIQAQLTSPLMNRFTGENPYLEFPKGFKIYMFDSVRQITSTITGNRGMRNESAHIMEAWGNVVVRNEKKNEQINTEHLIWEEKRHKIRSDVKVKITRPDQILYGTQMESNESFTNYSIQNPTGEMAVKKDSI